MERAKETIFCLSEHRLRKRAGQNIQRLRFKTKGLGKRTIEKDAKKLAARVRGGV